MVLPGPERGRPRLSRLSLDKRASEGTAADTGLAVAPSLPRWRPLATLAAWASAAGSWRRSRGPPSPWLSRSRAHRHRDRSERTPPRAPPAVHPQADRAHAGGAPLHRPPRARMRRAVGLSRRGAVVMGERTDARVAELADARDLGSRGQPWGFESPLSHARRRRTRA